VVLKAVGSEPPPHAPSNPNSTPDRVTTNAWGPPWGHEFYNSFFEFFPIINMYNSNTSRFIYRVDSIQTLGGPADVHVILDASSCIGSHRPIKVAVEFQSLCFFDAHIDANVFFRNAYHREDGVLAKWLHLHTNGCAGHKQCIHFVGHCTVAYSRETSRHR
jgi:hypothetical protein